MDFTFDMSQTHIIGNKLLHEFGSTSTITEGGGGGSEHTLDIASASSGNSGGSDGISNWKRPQYSKVI